LPVSVLLRVGSERRSVIGAVQELHQSTGTFSHLPHVRVFPVHPSPRA
jgi:hypothetical protein